MKRTELKRTAFKRKPPKAKATKGLSLYPKKETKDEEWSRIKREITPYFEKYGLYDRCELMLPNCKGYGDQYAHSKKRGDIAKLEPERTKELKEVVRACPSCHYKVEYPEKTAEETGRQIMYRIVLSCIDARNKRLQINSIYS
jgi:hypothetical protein